MPIMCPYSTFMSAGVSKHFSNIKLKYSIFKTCNSHELKHIYFHVFGVMS